ncbi:hypothetical protein ACRAWD_32040 [Caulobacter segnis]
MLPYVSYLHTGDRAVIDDNWSAMSAYLNGVLAENPGWPLRRSGRWRRSWRLAGARRQMARR